LVLAPDPT